MTTNNDKGPGTPEIDLDEVAKLLAALEKDLANVHGSAQDIQRLKDEVQTLKNVLSSPVRRHHWVRDGLHSIRHVFENAVDSAVDRGLKGSQYIAEIGRILGM